MATHTPGGAGRHRSVRVGCSGILSPLPGFGAGCPGKPGTMERGMGERLDMDEAKRQEMDQQAEEYVDDVAEMPAMNADPQARYPDHGTAEPTES